MADNPQQSGNNSVSAFLWALVPALIVFAVYLLIFVIMRKKQKRVYEPRSLVSTVPNDLQPENPPRGAFSWITTLMKKSETYLIQYAGVDGYFFIRFLFEFAIVCIFGILLTWPILFPINATNSRDQKGLDMLSYSNVKSKWRFLAHVFVSWVFFGSVLFLIYRELRYYTTFRHVLQTTPMYDSLLSSRTVLLTELPKDLMDEDELRQLFPSALKVWYYRKYKPLQKKSKERSKLANKYESTLNAVIKKAIKIRNKAIKKGKPVPEPENHIDSYLKKRPTHKLKPIIGKKVDTLDYGVEHISDLNQEIGDMQKNHTKEFEKVNAVFLEFPSQLELQKAYQACPYHPLLKKARRFIGVSPDDVIWDNLALSKYERWVKWLGATAFLSAMIIFWAIPVAFVGSLSNIYNLINKVKFLSFLLNLPSFLRGLVQGLLPVVLLAVLMMLVPIVIRLMGKLLGCITVQQVEAYCQSWYYAFQVVNVFLVVTLSSAASSSVTQIIENPGSALSMLSEYIPKASNFYISYLCLQGLSVSSGLLAQVVALILAQFLGKILDKTPRQKWNRSNILGLPGWSTTYPAFQLLAVIALCYSIIAPLILGFTAIAFVLFYLAFIYTLVYVLVPNANDAKGRNYPRALLQLFVGLYLAELCLIAMFVFGKNWVSVGLESVIGLVTVACHIFFRYKFEPLWEVVPISAIKYARGDVHATYPEHDHGRKEIQTEGKNYWEGGNQLVDEAYYKLESDESLQHHAEGKSELHDDDDHVPVPSSPSAPVWQEVKDPHPATEKGGPDTAPKNPVNWISRFFRPSSESFDLLRKIMPAFFLNYIEYNEDFVAHAYNDPAVSEGPPEIWVAEDNLGLAELEKAKAAAKNVNVITANAVFEKDAPVPTGPPPSYEEALKV
ncbi:uncharacterized protein KQ657_001065 [Scheffersomyces spartinae]|uniref:DUF221-domain-containing protein n=1 Tax=Scheffersomyces spartinae TaxID=45513 RepID=A0A9P8AIC0_9ASCO|nr:uncharacterized protein KQ657_001065 [Scheffersomyces spartinae]KAG7192960.1 hypothetical protein KQ657_001065 [Scheffersomyces spartinae]